jgi:diacylglycerol kinase family enzyme
VEQHPFFNLAGIGIDAVIAARFAERGLRRRGMAAYVELTTIELMRYRSKTYQLTIDDESFEQRAMLIALANGRQYGNRLIIAPAARLDDGRLEVVVVDQLPLWNVLWRLPSLFRGTLRLGSGIAVHGARTVRIKSSAPIPYHVDGEPHLGGEELAVRVHPSALLIKAHG